MDTSKLPGSWSYATDFSALKGLTITKIIGDEGSDSLMFKATNGRLFLMEHSQDCCESVNIEDICGDLDDLIGSPILLAEDESNEPEPELEYEPESYTWTFYKLSTIKGSVTIRWFGESNGYYSESVSFREFILDNSLVLARYKELLQLYTEEEVALMLLKALVI